MVSSGREIEVDTTDIENIGFREPRLSLHCPHLSISDLGSCADGVLGIDILRADIGIARRIPDNDSTAEAVQPMGIDIAVNADATECFPLSESESDDHPLWRFGSVWKNNQPFLRPLQSAEIFAHDLSALFHRTTMPLSERSSRLIAQVMNPCFSRAANQDRLHPFSQQFVPAELLRGGVSARSDTPAAEALVRRDRGGQKLRT